MEIANDLMLVLAELLLTFAIGAALMWVGYSCYYWPKKLRFIWATEAEQLFSLMEKKDEEKTAQQYGRMRVLRKRFKRRRLAVPEELHKTHHASYYDFLAGNLKGGFFHAYDARRRVVKVEKEEEEEKTKAETEEEVSRD